MSPMYVPYARPSFSGFYLSTMCLLKYTLIVSGSPVVPDLSHLTLWIPRHMGQFDRVLILLCCQPWWIYIIAIKMSQSNICWHRRETNKADLDIDYFLKVVSNDFDAVSMLSVKNLELRLCLSLFSRGTVNSSSARSDIRRWEGSLRLDQALQDQESWGNNPEKPSDRNWLSAGVSALWYRKSLLKKSSLV
jgi:hypothetical protein